MSERDPRDTGPARRGELDAGGHRLAALQAGPADGPPVLLVPGYTGSKEDFGPLFGPLGEVGLRVTAIDLPGQYESPGPDELAAYTPRALADVVRAAAAGLGDGAPVHLLGHSFGGLVARAAVMAGPEAFASLVLMDSGPGSLGGGRRDRLDRLRAVLPHGGLPRVLQAMRAEEAADPAAQARPPEVTAFLDRRFLATSPASLLGMGEALLVEPDLVDELAVATRSAGVPVLVLYGEDDDAWTPAAQAAMAERLDARTVVVPAAAHSPAVENPAATAQALRAFWTDR